MTVKLMKRVFSRWYGASILVTLDMNKQECYAQLNHDHTSTQCLGGGGGEKSGNVTKMCLPGTDKLTRAVDRKPNYF